MAAFNVETGIQRDFQTLSVHQVTDRSHFVWSESSLYETINEKMVNIQMAKI